MTTLATTEIQFGYDYSLTLSGGVWQATATPKSTDNRKVRPVVTVDEATPTDAQIKDLIGLLATAWMERTCS